MEKRDNYKYERCGAYIPIGNGEEDLGFSRIENILAKVL